MNEEMQKQIKYWLFVAVQDCGRWADKTFPKSTPASILAHMQEEMDELVFANNGYDTANMKEEAADVFLLLLHYCHKNEIDLGAEMLRKFEINQKRTWETEPNEQGYFKHTVAP